MHEDLEKVKLLARDLRDGKEFPRSPRATLAGYVLAARAVDKCRAVLVDWQGEYHSNCPLDQRWLNFAEIHYGDFRSLVATGATDDEIAEWIEKNAKKRPRAEIVAWNNKERDLRLYAQSRGEAMELRCPRAVADNQEMDLRMGGAQLRSGREQDFMRLLLPQIRDRQDRPDRPSCEGAGIEALQTDTVGDHADDINGNPFRIELPGRRA